MRRPPSPLHRAASASLDGAVIGPRCRSAQRVRAPLLSDVAPEEAEGRRRSTRTLQNSNSRAAPVGQIRDLADLGRQTIGRIGTDRPARRNVAASASWDVRRCGTPVRSAGSSSASLQQTPVLNPSLSHVLFCSSPIAHRAPPSWCRLALLVTAMFARVLLSVRAPNLASDWAAGTQQQKGRCATIVGCRAQVYTAGRVVERSAGSRAAARSAAWSSILRSPVGRSVGRTVRRSAGNMALAAWSSQGSEV